MSLGCLSIQQHGQTVISAAARAGCCYAFVAKEKEVDGWLGQTDR